MDEEKRRLRLAEKKRTVERAGRRHAKKRERDQYGLYRNKLAELALTFRPHDYWVKLWNMRQYTSDYEWFVPDDWKDDI